MEGQKGGMEAQKGATEGWKGGMAEKKGGMVGYRREEQEGDEECNVR